MIKELQTLCDVVRGSSPRPQGDPKYYGGPIPRLMVSDVTRDGMYVTPKIDSLTIEGATKSRPMKKGDVVIAVSGDAGEPCILNVDACIHDGFVGLRNLDEKKIFKPYLYQYLKSVKLRNSSLAVGAIYKNLNTDQIKAIKIPLPPLSEQKRIADLLDAADQLRKKVKALLEKYDQLGQSLFLEMFGENNSNNEVELGTIIKLIGGGTPSKDVEEYWNGNIPWASVKDLKSDILSSTIDHISELGLKNSVSKIIPAGSVIISTRMAVGKAVICKQDTAINQDLKGVKIIGNLNELYLLNLLKSKEEYFQSVSSGATVKGIKIEHITKLKVSLPEISLQNKFAEQVQLIEQQKELAKRNLEKSEALFGALMGILFN